jgi:hypothetical protein
MNRIGRRVKSIAVGLGESGILRSQWHCPTRKFAIKAAHCGEAPNWPICALPMAQPAIILLRA